MNRRHCLAALAAAALFPKPQFHPYRQPTSVGYRGWWEWLGKPVAWVTLEGKTVIV